MRKLALAIIVASTALTAAPAAAQYGQRGYAYDEDRRYGGRDLQRQIQQIDQRVQMAAQRGQLSPREAHRLSLSVDQLQRLYNRVARRGSERAYSRLVRDIQEVRSELRRDIRDRDSDDRRGRYYDRDDYNGW